MSIVIHDFPQVDGLVRVDSSHPGSLYHYLFHQLSHPVFVGAGDLRIVQFEVIEKYSSTELVEGGEVLLNYDVPYVTDTDSGLLFDTLVELLTDLHCSFLL